MGFFAGATLQIQYTITAANANQANSAKTSMAKLSTDPAAAANFLTELKKKDAQFTAVSDMTVVAGKTIDKPVPSVKDADVPLPPKNDKEKEMQDNTAKTQKAENCRRAETKEQCLKYCMACSDW